MKLAVVTMQKNESQTLRQWIDYYASLCGGFEHLYILDDSSTDTGVIELLRNAENQGVNVYWNRDEEQWFKNKGSVVTSLVQRIAPTYDWILPADADEFICLDIDSEPQISRTELFAELASASKPVPVVLRINSSFSNVPHTTTAFRTGTKKICLNRDAGMSIRFDGGFHLYDWTNKIDTVEQKGVMHPSKLATIHFHHRPFAEMLAASREKLKHWVPDFKQARMRSYRGRSRHVTQFLRMSEDEYMQSFKAKKVLSIEKIFAERGLQVPYSQAFVPMSDAERRRLADPVNSYRYRPSRFSSQAIKTMVKNVLYRIKRSLCAVN